MGETLTLHASCVALDGRGVLILGRSGAGKSSLALELMALGARLVADDRTVLHADDGAPVASCPPAILGKIEARGVGILAADPSPVDDLDRQETLLRERWWEQPQVIVLHAVGVVASVVAGSSMLAAASAQARGVERAMRGDDVVLARTKVRRRG